MCKYQAWDQLHSKVMHYRYITLSLHAVHYHYFIFWKVIQYITFHKFQPKKLVHIETFITGHDKAAIINTYGKRH